MTLEEAKVALAAIPKADRDWVLSLPAKEAARVIETLVAFPGSTFVGEDVLFDTPEATLYADGVLRIQESP